MGAGGRPLKKIKKETFESLCKIQCTEPEICAVLEVSDVTLNKWCKAEYGKSFLEVFREKREGGKASLRRNQWKMSETNPTMAIWLGKQFLGQTDKQEVKNTVQIDTGEAVDSLRKAIEEENGNE